MPLERYYKIEYKNLTGRGSDEWRSHFAVCQTRFPTREDADKALNAYFVDMPCYLVRIVKVSVLTLTEVQPASLKVTAGYDP